MTPHRLAAYEAVSTGPALLGNRQLGHLWQEASPHGHGIGGATRLLEVAGRPVFAKAVPLTDGERRPENVMSTANLFGLPCFYQYGVGSTGFGAWRELATHVMTTNWVLTGQCGSFPLMYHWRVIPGPGRVRPRHRRAGGDGRLLGRLPRRASQAGGNRLGIRAADPVPGIRSAQPARLADRPAQRRR